MSRRKRNIRARILGKPIGNLSKSEVKEALPELSDFESQLLKDMIMQVISSPEDVVHSALGIREEHDFDAMWDDYLNYIEENSDGTELDGETMLKMWQAMQDNPVAWKIAMSKAKNVSVNSKEGN